MADAAHISHPKPPASRPSRRLLLVDDNAEGRRALARLMELYGFEVTAVGDGASAAEALRGGKPPDIVLTDLILPDIDGRDIAKLARALTPSPVIVLITGWDFDGEGITAQQAGVDLIFLKPVDVGELVRKVNEYRPSVS